VSIARASAVDAASQVAVIAMSLAAGIVMSRVLGAGGQGVYVLATTTANALLLNAASLGLGLSLQVHAAREPERTAELHAAALLVSLGVGVLVGGLLLAFGSLVRSTILKGMDAFNLVVVAATFPFVLYQFSCVGLLNGMGAVRQRALLELAIGACQAVALVSILLARGTESIRLLVVAYYAIATAGAAATMILVGRRTPLWRLPRRELLARLIGYGKWVYAGNFASRLRLVIDQLLVNFYGGGIALGVYHRGASLAGRSMLFAKSLESASYRPISASAHAEGARLAAAAFRQMLILGVALSIAGWIVAPVIPVIYGEEFAESVAPFRLLVPALCLLGAARMLAIYFSGCLARPQIPMAINWATVVFQGAASLYLAGRLGPLAGITWAAAATHTLAAALFIALFARRGETPGLDSLFVLRRDDFLAWTRLLPSRRAGG